MNSEASGLPGSQAIGLLLEQRDLYLKLQNLSGRQRGCITGNEPEQLLTILAERQQLIDRLQSIGQRLRPLQANWRQIREGMDEAQGRQIDGLLTEVNGLLSKILEQDAADSALLSARKSETGRQIGLVQTGQQASRAYAATYGGTSPGADWT